MRVQVDDARHQREPAGIDWRFQSFAEYLTMLRGRGAYMNLGVLVGHSAVRTAVMGEAASVRKQPTAAELAEMKWLVAEAMDQGAIGLGGSYSLNHSGWGACQCRQRSAR